MTLTPQEIDEFVAQVFPSAAGSGMKCIEVGDGTAVVRLEFDAQGLRPGGIIPGPRVFALADAALWFAVFTKIGLAPMAVTSDMTIHLPPARHRVRPGGKMFANEGRQTPGTRRDPRVAGRRESRAPGGIRLGFLRPSRVGPEPGRSRLTLGFRP